MTTGEDKGETDTHGSAGSEAMADLAQEAGQATFRRLEATLAAAQDGESCGQAAQEVRALAQESLARTAEIGRRR